MTNQKLIEAIELFDKDIFANSPNQLELIIDAARESEKLREQRDYFAQAIIIIHDDQEGDYDFIKFISHPAYKLAKRIIENGNA